MVGGVAAGLARSMSVSIGVVRVLFAVLTIVGGMGVALYLAGWILIRSEDESEAIAQRWLDSIRSGPAWIGVALLALAALIILDTLTFLSAPLLWATVLVVVGVLLYRGDLAPRSPEDPRPSGGGPGRATDDPVSAGVAGANPPLPPPAYVPSTPAVPPTPPPPPSILGRLTIGAGLLALGALAVVDNLSALIDPRPRHYIALATVVLGVGLMVGGFLGRARWLVLLGVFLVPPLLASPAAEVDWQRGLNRTVSPSELTDLAPNYRAAAGRYEFDLTESDWDGQTIDLDVELAAGVIHVIVPQNVAVTGTARVNVGEIEAPGGNRAGMGEIERQFNLPGEAGTIDLDLVVGAGGIHVDRAQTER